MKPSELHFKNFLFLYVCISTLLVIIQVHFHLSLRINNRKGLCIDCFLVFKCKIILFYRLYFDNNSRNQPKVLCSHIDYINLLFYID